MLNASHALQAYKTASRYRSQRDQEADVFRQAIAALKSARNGSPIQQIRALTDNRRLWTTVGDLLRDPGNALPEALRAGILSVATWPWLFAINLPIGVATLFAARALPRTPHAARSFDTLSALLNALFFGLLIVAIDSVGHGELALYSVLAFAGAGLAGVALVVRQLPRTSPLLPVDLLCIPLFALSIATSVCSFTAQMLAYIAMPFYFQDALGRGAVATPAVPRLCLRECWGCDEPQAVHLRWDSADRLSVGYRSPGLRLRVAPGGRTRKLQDILTDAKVPRAVRDHLPLVFCGGHLAWIPGLAVSTEFEAGGAGRAPGPSWHVTMDGAAVRRW